MRTIALVSALILTAGPALADSTTGTVAAFDRVANIIVLDDKTIWEIPANLPLPDALQAGDTITIDWISNGDNGVGSYNSIVRSES